LHLIILGLSQQQATMEMKMESEAVFLSLADIAGMSTDDIAPILSRVPESGIYRMKCKGAVLKSQEAAEEGKPPRFSVGYRYEVMFAKLVDKNIDANALIGRTLSENVTLWNNTQSALIESIGILKGRYQKVGLATSGAMGGVEGSDPGWIDGAVEAEFNVGVRKSMINGEPRAFYDWIKPDPKFEAAYEAALNQAATSTESQTVDGAAQAQ
jgi:hypothetical protein